MANTTARTQWSPLRKEMVMKVIPRTEAITERRGKQSADKQQQTGWEQKRKDVQQKAKRLPMKSEGIVPKWLWTPVVECRKDRASEGRAFWTSMHSKRTHMMNRCISTKRTNSPQPQQSNRDQEMLAEVAPMMGVIQWEVGITKLYDTAGEANN